MDRWIGTRKQLNEQSPLYSGTKTNLTAGEVVVQDLLYTKPYDNYNPFNFFRVMNKTDKDIIVLLNDYTLLIPSGIIQSVDADTIPAFSNFQIKSADGSACTGNIFYQWQKLSTLKQVVEQKRGFF